MNQIIAPLAENEYVKEMFAVMQKNGKDTGGLSALITHVAEMEKFVKLAEEKISVMQSQLDTIKEMRNHPVKTMLKNTIRAITGKVAEIKGQLTKMKSNVIAGCKNAAEEVKNRGITALDTTAWLFNVKDVMQSVKDSAAKTIKHCDKGISDIDAFSKQYHETGLAIKNMGRMLTGKEKIDTANAPGKLAKTVSAPYKAQKSCMLGIQKAAGAMIVKLDKLEQTADKIRDVREITKKPMLMQKLEANKAKIKQLKLDKPVRERVPIGKEIGA